MFKTAATRIAHNSTISALAGNSDLRPLQDLITAEKGVLISLQKLSVDFTKSAEALRIWGTGEGEDLGDILGASTVLLNTFANALSQYASHGHSMREQLKSIRSREERLDELKRRRKTVGAKADTAERKLSKMSPEHKNLATQTETLNNLRAEMRQMDFDIMTEEAALGDFKRTTTKSWMGLKFGGLLECCEKGVIVGECGKLVVTELPEEYTQPGMPRSMYYGHKTSESLLAEANRRLSGIVLTTAPSTRQLQPLSRPGVQEAPMNLAAAPAPLLEPSGWSSTNYAFSADPPNYLPPPQGLGSGQFLEQSPVPASMATGSSSHLSFTSQTSVPPTLPYPQIDEPTASRSLDDFGVSTPSTAVGPYSESGPSGGRFATFPVKNRGSGPDNLDAPPSLRTRHDLGLSFSSTMAEALGSSEPTPTYVESFNDPMARSSLDKSSPPYAPSQEPPDTRPGLAVSDVQRAQNTLSQYSDDAVLAYAGTNEGDPAGGQEAGDDRHVRFGAVSDIENAQDPRSIGPQTPVYAAHPPSSDRPGPLTDEQTLNQTDEHRHVQPQGHDDKDINSNTLVQAPPQLRRRLSREEELELDAAAAREVGREMDALVFNPPVPADKGYQPPPRVGTPQSDREQPLPPPPHESLRRASSPSNMSDLAPPSAPFARRTPSPHPNIDAPSNRPGSLYSPPGHAYAQAHMVNFSQEPSPLDQPPAQVDNSPTIPISPPSINTSIPPALQGESRQYSPAVEHPRSLGIGIPSNRSTSSPPSPLPPGGRTISAAAFKRPLRMGSADVKVPEIDTSPLLVKKRLPSSPYPANREGPSLSIPPKEPSHPLPVPPTQNLLQDTRAPTTDLDEEYDYLSAYVNTGSLSETGGLGPSQIANEAEYQSRSQGYGTGQFSTNLEGSHLR